MKARKYALLFLLPLFYGDCLAETPRKRCTPKSITAGDIVQEEDYCGRLITCGPECGTVKGLLRIISIVTKKEIRTSNSIPEEAMFPGLRVIDKPWDMLLDVVGHQYGLSWRDTGDTIEFFNSLKSKGAGRNSPKFTGRLISVDFQDTELATALRIIAEVSNLEIVITDQEVLSRKVTLKMVDFPWDHVLDVLLVNFDIETKRFGSVLSLLTKRN